MTLSRKLRTMACINTRHVFKNFSSINNLLQFWHAPVQGRFVLATTAIWANSAPLLDFKDDRKIVRLCSSLSAVFNRGSICFRFHTRNNQTYNFSNHPRQEKRGPFVPIMSYRSVPISIPTWRGSRAGIPQMFVFVVSMDWEKTWLHERWWNISTTPRPKRIPNVLVNVQPFWFDGLMYPVCFPWVKISRARRLTFAWYPMILRQ